MDIFYHPHMDREIESLIERIHPPRVCIDNDSCRECTVVKVDSANKHGILLEMVQVLTDLDLIISRSYISSDGGWFMDVFHVTDQAGKKLTDETLMLHIQQKLCTTRRKGNISSDEDDETTSEPYGCDGPHSPQNTALEMTGLDRPGLLSEIAAVLAELGCTVTSGMAWTHNDRAACIIYVEDALKAGPIKDPIRLGHVQEQLQNVVEAHGDIGERKSVRLRNLAAGRTHTERRLHQLMYADRDYESCRACHGESSGEHKKGCDGTHVSVSRCKDKGYWVVNVRSRDRPKLLFDTVCVLTDLHYVVFHAAIRSKSSMAEQEYFIKHAVAGACLDEESERQKLILCLIAAIERRVSHVRLIPPTIKGLRVDIRTKNRTGLLSNVTRVFRENGLSVSRVEIGTQGDNAVGSFFVTDSSGQQVNPNIAELVRQECGGTVVTDHKSPYRVPKSSSSSLLAMDETTNNLVAKPIVSIGNMLWSQIERLSGSFGSIRS
ncbi:ACT domain-containing protein ACR1 isoform X1 [Arachis ipaensis]|uniref:ACT domain-containing protein ACR1 isoform X1 n=1 Tax=Arachis ipaensis TaxID=130454 RepID=UPI0007AF030A|nr:ACT domain-containing protein ACR1 isoform X1 [Arachis ipaensis]XP_016201600.1 ACT domain-containing protein ACR1 isoform X1 [Arachis ipaensis]XP_025652211.1 ACT domain-containing protein ACR1 isoform X1 [Arachis hypogaea]XP_025652212.1 ACT domain-containing protein ACR1 isoform X1 [Arachis hypogaea]